ncbi:MAG: LytTR family DNA-binding domain-containing protein [Methylobacillus sp.]|nr:LytTR family DNA-binding domain-containing protein [Methylobacillus sp.]
MKITALIAEDEPLAAQALRNQLGIVWPELEVVACVTDGLSAVRETLAHLPQVLFLDIRIPGLDGLGVAAKLAESWPADAAPMPHLVYVTAYDEHAIRAFEVQATDYLLKPVSEERLRHAMQRVQTTLAQRTAAAPAPAVAPLLKLIPVSETGGNVRMISINEVLYFEAEGHYVRILTTHREHLIRTPFKQLLAQLDAQVFWQVHRSTAVRSDAIESVHRDEFGKRHLQLRGCPKKIPVSPAYAHLFKPM